MKYSSYSSGINICFVQINLTEKDKKLIFTFFSSSSAVPWSYLEIFWTVAFSLIVITAVLGNCLVLWIVCGKEREGMRNRGVKNCFGQPVGM